MIPQNVQELIKIYQRSQAKLLEQIQTKQKRGNLALYQKRLVAQINAEIDKLNKQVMYWTDTEVRKEYSKGVNEAIKGVLNEPIQDFNAFNKLHTYAMDVLVQNTTNKLVTANQFVGRTLKDTIRHVSMEVIQEKVAEGLTIRETRNRIVNRLIDENGAGVLMKNGRRMNLVSYAETVARSTTREATNTGTMNHLTANGYDLVKMSSHATKCGVCAPLEGRVYSISGNNPQYPPLTRAYGGVYANIHPNCRHVLTPYIEKYNDVEKDREFSNRSFDTDPRSQAGIDRYNNEQRENQKLNYDRRQWERYKLALPDDAPKTLSGFRTMKKANSERYKQLVSDYRSIRQQQN